MALAILVRYLVYGVGCPHLKLEEKGSGAIATHYSNSHYSALDARRCVFHIKAYEARRAR